MNFNEIKELIEIIHNSNLSYFEMQDEKDYIKIDKSISRNYTKESLDINNLNKLAITDTCERLELSDNLDLGDDFDYIKSPIVGTYYKAISPDAEPFVSVGQKISEGEVLCIIEAMKLMNEINTEFDCEIVNILVENGSMVEYGEPLFKVRRI